MTDAAHKIHADLLALGQEATCTATEYVDGLSNGDLAAQRDTLVTLLDRIDSDSYYAPRYRLHLAWCNAEAARRV